MWNYIDMSDVILNSSSSRITRLKYMNWKLKRGDDMKRRQTAVPPSSSPSSLSPSSSSFAQSISNGSDKRVFKGRNGKLIVRRRSERKLPRVHKPIVPIDMYIKRCSISLQNVRRDNNMSSSMHPFSNDRQCSNACNGAPTNPSSEVNDLRDLYILEDELRTLSDECSFPMSAECSIGDRISVASPSHPSYQCSRLHGIHNTGKCNRSALPVIPIQSQAFKHIVSSSAPSSSLDIDSVLYQNQQSPNEFETKDRRKKELHNQIERRRRYNINDRIKELEHMLPKQAAEEMKLNKGTILKATCEYIRQLRKDREIMLTLQQREMDKEEEIRRLRDHINNLKKFISSHGLSTPPCTSAMNVSQSTVSARILNELKIKEEACDDLRVLTPNSTNISLSSGVFLPRLSETTAAMMVASPNGHANSRNSQCMSDYYDSSYASMDGFSPSDEHSFMQENWKPKTSSQPFHELIMLDDIAASNSGPLMQGDPLISTAGPSSCESINTQICCQMSPVLKWDQPNFSNEDHRNHVISFNSYLQPSNMDLS